MPAILGQLEHPHTFTKALAEMEIRKPVSEVARVDLSQMLDTIARTLQLRFYSTDFAITDPSSRQRDRNELVIDLEPSALTTNPGMIWSALYNLAKNACREFGAGEKKMASMKQRLDDPDFRPRHPQYVYLQCREISDRNVTMISITDSGQGLRLDDVMNSMKALLSENLLDTGNLTKSVALLLEQWKQNPFALRKLNVGNVIDCAALARVSGFSARQHVSGPRPSGMGLWGVVYLTERMGGKLLSTNMNDGGALFTIILPNNYFGEKNDQVRRNVVGVRKDILKGLHNARLPRIAA